MFYIWRLLPIQARDRELDTTARLRVAIGKLSRHLRPTAVSASAGLTPTGVSILLTVARIGPIRLSELAAGEGLNPTMLSRVVADLCESGFAKRVTDPTDGRAALVKATADGRRLCERIRRERTDSLKVGLDKLSESERDALQKALPALEDLAEQLKRGRA